MLKARDKSIGGVSEGTGKISSGWRVTAAF